MSLILLLLFSIIVSNAETEIETDASLSNFKDLLDKLDHEQAQDIIKKLREMASAAAQENKNINSENLKTAESELKKEADKITNQVKTEPSTVSVVQQQTKVYSQFQEIYHALKDDKLSAEGMKQLLDQLKAAIGQNEEEKSEEADKEEVAAVEVSEVADHSVAFVIIATTLLMSLLGYLVIRLFKSTELLEFKKIRNHNVEQVHLLPTSMYQSNNSSYYQREGDYYAA